MKIQGLYFITDSTLTRNSTVKDVTDAVRAGVEIVQYREKCKTLNEMMEEADELRKICKGVALLLINDYIEIAKTINADGVHLGQDDIICADARKLLGTNKIIGITVHNVEEAVKAEKNGADYLGVSPIFATKTKKNARAPLGIDIIKEIRKNVHIPIVAVGGINLANILSVLDAGADSISAVSAIITKDNVEEECRKFIKIISEFKNTSR